MLSYIKFSKRNYAEVYLIYKDKTQMLVSPVNCLSSGIGLIPKRYYSSISKMERIMVIDAVRS